MAESKSQQNLSSIVKAYTWQNLVSDLKNQPKGLRTGYPSLDNYIRIPHGAITVIGGRTKNGKTSFQLNLLRNMLQDETLENCKFYFFSYEEDKKYLATKLIMIMAGEVLQADRNVAAYLNYLPKFQAENSKAIKRTIKVAIQKFQEYTSIDARRLYFIDEPYSGQKLAAILGELGKDRRTGAVFIDYIQKIPVEGIHPQSQRYLEIQKVSRLLQNTAKAGDIPIIVGAQMGREISNEAGKPATRLRLRESADIEQDASIVLGITRESIEKGKVADPTKPEPLMVDILKNRAGPGGQRVTLTFEGPTLRISDRRSF